MRRIKSTGLKVGSRGDSKWTKRIDGAKIPEMMAIETSAVQYGSITCSMKQNNVVVVIVQTRLTNLLNVIYKVKSIQFQSQNRRRKLQGKKSGYPSTIQSRSPSSSLSLKASELYPKIEL